MSNQSKLNALSTAAGALLLFSMAGAQVAVASDQVTDPQVQAAQVFQHPQTWISRADEVMQAGRDSSLMLDAQAQARRVLQPVNEASSTGTMFSVADQILAAESVDPQLQAARVLSHPLHLGRQ